MFDASNGSEDLIFYWNLFYFYFYSTIPYTKKNLDHFSICLNELNFLLQLTPNWFPSAEASHKRSDIHKLINEIIENQSLNPFPASCSIQNHSKFPASDLIKEEAVEFLSEQHVSTKKSCLTNSLPTIFDREVEIQFPAPSSPSGVQYGKEMGTVSSEFFEHGNVARSSPDEQYPLCDQIATFEMLYCPISTLEVIQLFSYFSYLKLSL